MKNRKKAPAPTARVLRSAAVLLLCRCALVGLLAQGTRAQYERALHLREIVRGKVFRDRVRPRWFDGGKRFWYRVETGPKSWEFVRVDAAAGRREAAFDHDALAEALSKALGRQTDPAALPIGALAFPEGKVEFDCEGKRWRFDPAARRVKPLKKPAQEAGLVPLKRPRPSRAGGRETELVFVNRTKKLIRLFWIDMDGNRRPYGTLAPGARRAQHTYSGHVWLVEDASGKPLGVFEAAETGGEAIIEDGRGTARPKRARSNRPAPPAPRRSRWRARIIDNNVWLESTSAGERVQITRDGSAEDGYREPFYPSPDGRWLVVMKTRKGDDRKVCLIESSPKDRLQPKLHSFAYLKPGDRVPLPRPVLIDLRSRRAIAVSSALCANPYAISRCRWAPDSSEFYFLYNQRGHQLLRLLALNPRTGRVRSVVEERSRTFVDYAHKTYIRFLDKTGELIWMSERDGWNHLYLYDLRTGRIKRQITKGPWAVRRVVRVEPEKRRIWFYAGGVRPGQNPYCLHLCRANFDGSGFRILTEGNGTHEAAFSPDKRFFLDRWSRVDLPPVTELREAESGRLLCVLERADWSALLAAGWSPPEQFVAKGRDGKTDIYGVIYKPSRFDPSRKYPILEEIYAGPQSAYTPTAFGLQIRQHAMAELGFIVVQIDGMGTSWRSRAFHDVCWRNLGDAGIPDRVRWIRAAAARRPYMDLERVGIYGGSAGGQNALRALLVRGDFYKAAVADCGCHDNRMDKLWWNELWMGWPVGPHYAEQSNVTQAHRLQGKLLLMVGELDHNVDPASTYQVVNALIQANKDFELIVQPGVGHGSAETSYGSRRRMDFLVRALWGVEPRSRP